MGRKRLAAHLARAGYSRVRAKKVTRGRREASSSQGWPRPGRDGHLTDGRLSIRRPLRRGFRSIMRLLSRFFQNSKGAISHNHERVPILRVHEPSDDDDDRDATGRQSAFAIPPRPSSSSSNNEESMLGNVEALVPHPPSSCETTGNVENSSQSIRQVATDSQVYTHRRGNFGLLFITLAQLCFSIMNM